MCSVTELVLTEVLKYSRTKLSSQSRTQHLPEHLLSWASSKTGTARGVPQCSGETPGILDPRALEKSTPLHPAPATINDLLQQSHVFYHNTNDTQWKEHGMGVLTSELFRSCIKVFGFQCLEAAPRAPGPSGAELLSPRLPCSCWVWDQPGQK